MSEPNVPLTKPGEEDGKQTSEQKAAEQPTDTAKETNPVAEATGRESKDPYAEGKAIANPEPNNGAGVSDDDKDLTERDVDDAAADDKSAETAADQNEVEAKANTPDANLPDEEKTAPANQPHEGSSEPDAPEQPASN